MRIFRETERERNMLLKLLWMNIAALLVTFDDR